MLITMYGKYEQHRGLENETVKIKLFEKKK